MKLPGPLFAPFLALGAAFSTAQTTPLPNVSYSTFFNGNGATSIRASAVDANGDQYVTGFTLGSEFPTTPGAYRRTLSPGETGTGSRQMFVAKLNRAGTGLIYSTLIADALPNSIAIDGAGNAYVVGQLNSAVDFPTTSGAWLRSCVLPDQLGCNFVLKLNATGSGLVFSTLLNAKACRTDTGETFEHIALDNEGHAHVLGNAGSDCYTTANAYKRTFPSLGVNPIIMKLKTDGSGVLYSTYLGGNNSVGQPRFGDDWSTAIAVDSNGRAVIAGFSMSSDFPTTQSAFQRSSHGGESDAFVAKLSPDGSTLLASTLLGGSDSDSATDVNVDPFNQVYVVGSTASMDFPVTTNAFLRNHDPEFCNFEEGGVEFRCTDAFVVKLPMDFSKPAYSTFLGGQNGDETSIHVAADGVGHAFVAGQSNSTSFPLVKPTSSASELMWLSELSIDGARLLFSTRYGSGICCTANTTAPSGIGLDLASNAYVSGNADFVLTTPNAFQPGPANDNSLQAFAAKWDIPPCTLGNNDRTVTICTPASTTTTGPKKLLLAAGATDSRNVSGMKVYVDGIAVFSILASHFNTYLNLNPGEHHITVKAWDNVGPFSQSMNILAQ
jgi:hypothetical protein